MYILSTLVSQEIIKTNKKQPVTSRTAMHACCIIFASIVFLACRENEFQCLDGRGCIDFRRLCDGETDCPDNSDESNCGESVLG